MARLPPTARALARRVAEADHPVYLLDEQARVIFCNQACAQWVGVPIEMLLGQKCLYHSQADPGTAQAAASGLVPPPEAWTGWATVGLVMGGRFAEPIRRRLACFLPLKNEDGEPIGLLAILQEEDLPEDFPEGKLPPLTVLPADEAASLHEQLRQFHLEKAGRYRMDVLLGQGMWMQRVRAQADAAARARANVVIVGPPGSGRQHTAQAIYYTTDPTHRGPLVPLDCAILPEEVIQSTLTHLFRRYPPGASQQPVILLQEVDQLPQELHRMLEQLAKNSPSAVHVLATAQKNLLTLAAEGSFPPEAAAWLSTIVIELPPLAHRREDIPLLAQAFVEQFNAEGQKQIRGFTPEALDRLDAYPWPGNLDELAQVVLQACQKAEEPLITSADLPQTIHLAWEARAYPRLKEETIILDEFLKKIERELLQRAMHQAKANKAKAARLLGISRPRLYRLLQEHGFEEP